MESEKFLVFFIKWCGWMEIVIGIFFFFIDTIFSLIGLPNSPFFSYGSGVMVIILGYLLQYSARDLKTYLVIPVTSCIFRFAMAPIELYALFITPILAPVFIFGMSWDIFSAALTLILLKKEGYFN